MNIFSILNQIINKKLKRVKQILYNFLASGLRGSLIYEDVRKVTLINLFALCGIFYLLFYSHRMWLLNDPKLSLIYIYCIIVIILMQVYLRLRKRIQFVSHILVIGLLCLELFFLFRNGATNLNLSSYYVFPGIYWYYIFPPFTIFLLGRKVGSFYNIALVGFTIFFFTTNYFDSQLYDREFKVRLLSVYSAIFFFSFFFESVRKITFDAFEKTYSKKIKYLKLISSKNIALRSANKELSQLSEEFKTQNDYLKVLNKELVDQNDKIAIQNKLLQVQGKEMAAQRDLLIKQRQSIDDSILYASYIQSALLPNDSILKESFSDYFILYKPRSIISGDFYFFRKVDDYIIIAAADCTGHGVPGALLSMLGIASLSEIIYRMGITNASFILNEMCREMRSIVKKNEEYDAKDGIDISICKIGILNHELEFAGAHNPVYIVRNNELTHLRADKISVGRSMNNSEPVFTNQYMRLQKDDCIYLFSDGFSDQLRGSDRKKFLAKNFQKLLIEISHQNMSKQKSILEDTFEKWRAGGDQTDDMMILGVKV